MDSRHMGVEASTAADVLRVSAGLGALVVALAAVLALGGGAGFRADSVVLAAVGVPPLLWATWRPWWLSGIAATGAAAAPLAYSVLGIVVIPVLALATLFLCGQRVHSAWAQHVR